MIWPFVYMPGWANFLALWTGYSIILLTVYIIVLATLRWWLNDYRDEEMEHWDRLTAEVDKKVDKH